MIYPKRVKRWYQIDAVRNGCELPTFFLDADIQGIVTNEQAAKVAFNLLGDGLTVIPEMSCNVYNRQTGEITTFTREARS